jgi:hypothetical protein
MTILPTTISRYFIFLKVAVATIGMPEDSPGRKIGY